MRWLCTKCSAYNEKNKTRCSFCGEPSSQASQANHDISKQQPGEEKLTTSLHNIINKLQYNQKRKLFMYMEDNFL